MLVGGVGQLWVGQRVSESPAEVVDEVGGEQRLHALVVGQSQVASQGVNPYTQAGGILGGIVLSQKSQQDARQDIATATYRHAGIAMLGVAPDGAVGQIDVRLVAFYNQNEAVLLCQSGRVVAQTFHLADVGRKDGVRWHLFQPIGVQGEDIEGIGVEHHRPMILFQEVEQRRLRVGMLTQAGTDAEHFGVGRHDDEAVVVGTDVAVAFGFGDAQLQNLVTAGRHPHGEQTYTTAHTGSGGQKGGSHHATAACHQQGASVVALVTVGAARSEQVVHPFFRQYIHLIGIEKPTCKRVACRLNPSVQVGSFIQSILYSHFAGL